MKWSFNKEFEAEDILKPHDDISVKGIGAVVILQPDGSAAYMPLFPGQSVYGTVAESAIYDVPYEVSEELGESADKVISGCIQIVDVVMSEEGCDDIVTDQPILIPLVYAGLEITKYVPR